LPIELIVDGIVIGCIIALAALGLTLVWGIERFANISQGDTLTLAAYLTMFFHVTAGLHILLAALASVVGTSIAVMIFYYLVFRPLSHAPRVMVLVSSIGVALAIRSIVSIVWGTRLESYHLPLQRDYQFGAVLVSPVALLIVGATACLVGLTYLVLYRTRAGVEMRAVADLPDLARVVGIHGARVKQQVWLINAIVAAIGGILLGAYIVLTPLLGWSVLLAAFAASVLGGIGNPLGAVAGGLVLGLAMQLSTLLISPVYTEAVAFAVLAAVLLLRPRGLLIRADAQ
jgi:branched-subunit amino acid ABC-type transport system permease component